MDDSNNGTEFIERRSTPTQLATTKVELAPRKTIEAFPTALRQVIGDDDDPSGVDLRHFFQVIKNHKWKIAMLMALSMTATVFVTLNLRPLYKSSVKINVERRGGNGFIGPQATVSSGSDSDQFITTQVEILRSDTVLRPATEKYHLLDVENQFAGLKPEQALRLRKAPIELKRLKIKHVPNSYLIDLSYEAPDPQLAADAANAIAASYMEHAFDSRDRSYVRASVAIERQLKDLQAKMIESGKTLSKFNQQMNIIDPEQRVSILSARLLQLDTDYTAAQSDRLRKEAVLNSTKSGDLAAAQVSSHAETLQRLIDSLNLARQDFATVRTTYAESHPAYKTAKNKLTELETQFQELRTNTLQQVQQDYNQALAREQMAYKLVGESKIEFDHLNTNAFEYQQLKSDADNYKKLYQDLDRVTREEDINRSFQNSIVQVEDAARAAAKKSFPIMWLNLLLSCLLSGMAGIFGVSLFEKLDTKIRNVEDAAKLLNVDVLASLPKTKRFLEIGRGRSGALVGKMPKSKRTKMFMQYNESIRVLRNNIDFAGLGLSLRSLLVTSASPGEGKSTIAANLAFSYALLDKKVLIIDTDMRRPSLHTIFEKKAAHGLAEVLEEQAEWKGALLKVAREHLFLLPAGQITERSADMVGGGLQKILDQAYEEFDLVVLDGPPLLGAPEAAQLAAVAASVLVVTRAGHSSMKQVEAAYAQLRRARANIIGMVMDDVADTGRVDYSYEAPPALLESV